MDRNQHLMVTILDFLWRCENAWVVSRWSCQRDSASLAFLTFTAVAADRIIKMMRTSSDHPTWWSSFYCFRIQESDVMEGWPIEETTTSRLSFDCFRLEEFLHKWNLSQIRPLKDFSHSTREKKFYGWMTHLPCATFLLNSWDVLFSPTSCTIAVTALHFINYIFPWRQPLPFFQICICGFSWNWILHYFPLFVCPSVRVSQAWHLTFLTYIKA